MFKEIRGLFTDTLFVLGLALRLLAIAAFIPAFHNQVFVPAVFDLSFGDGSLTSVIDSLGNHTPRLPALLFSLPMIPVVVLGDIVGTLLGHPGLLYVLIGLTTIFFDLLLLIGLQRHLQTSLRSVVLHYWISPVVIALWYWVGAPQIVTLALFFALVGRFQTLEQHSRAARGDVVTACVGFAGLLFLVADLSIASLSWIVPILVARQVAGERYGVAAGELWSFVACAVVLFGTPLGHLRFISEELWTNLPSLSASFVGAPVLLVLAGLSVFATLFLLEWYFFSCSSAEEMKAGGSKRFVTVIKGDGNIVKKVGDLVGRLIPEGTLLDSQDDRFQLFPSAAPIRAILKSGDPRSFNEPQFLGEFEARLRDENRASSLLAVLLPDGARLQTLLARADFKVYIGDTEPGSGDWELSIIRVPSLAQSGPKTDNRVGFYLITEDLLLISQLKRLLVGYCGLSVRTESIADTSARRLRIQGRISTEGVVSASQLIGGPRPISDSVFWGVGDIGVMQLVIASAIHLRMGQVVDDGYRYAA